MLLFDRSKQSSLSCPPFCCHAGVDVHIQPPHEVDLSLPLRSLFFQLLPPLVFSEFLQRQPFEFCALFFQELDVFDWDLFQFFDIVFIDLYVEQGIEAGIGFSGQRVALFVLLRFKRPQILGLVW